jgi:hypothetical protein
MQEKYIAWRPSKAESKPPINPFKGGYCGLCLQEKKNRRDWNESCGTVQENLEMLSYMTTKEEAIAWWEDINEIEWPVKEFLQLARKYFYHLANIVSQEYWGKSISKDSLTLALPYYR